MDGGGVSRLVAIDGGTAFHGRALREAPFETFFDGLIPVRSLGQVGLSEHDCVLVPCRTNGQRLAKHRAQLEAYIEGGGYLVVMGETRPDLFLSGVRFRSIPTNYWWWLDPKGGLDLSIEVPGHPLFRRLGLKDLTWHVHGTLDIVGPCDVLMKYLDPAAGGSIMLEARRGRGRLFMTTLDPIFHHGSGFMPATTRFLEAFLPWLRASI